MSRGRVIVGVTADAAQRLLVNALPTLRQIGTDVVDVQHRGSFAFIAVKSFPAKTVLRKVPTEALSHTQPAHLNAIITGIHGQRSEKNSGGGG